MGLDMYLYRRRYVKAWDHQSPRERPTITLAVGGEEIPLVNPAYVIEEVGYWRKANQIHAWFVHHCQNGVDECQEADVDLEQLAGLLQICVSLLKSRSAEDAVKQLPPQEGFFFGSTDVDEYYWEDIAETVRILTPLVADPQACIDGLYYQSSW